MSSATTFKFDETKQLEVMLWITNQNPAGVDKYLLLKTIFYADKFHLNKYGRLIFGGGYTAMKAGPVHSQAYDLIKTIVRERWESGDQKNNSFTVDLDADANPYIVKASRHPNLDFLSKSDIEALTFAWEKCKDLDYEQLKELSHQEKSYQNAWGKRGISGAFPIDFEDLIENQSNLSKALIGEPKNA